MCVYVCVCVCVCVCVGVDIMKVCQSGFIRCVFSVCVCVCVCWGGGGVAHA